LKILHLDDHVLFAEGLSAVISQHAKEIEIISADDAEKGLMLIEQNQDIDLIFIDLNMPGLNGLAFIDSINERELFIPFVVLSASEDIWDIREALESGAAGFIPKTYKCQKILEIIGQVMLGDVYVPNNILAAMENLPEKKPPHDQHKILSAYKLGQRQFDILKLMRQGYSNDEMAVVLNISKNTIKTHVKTLFTSFQVKNRLECVRYAERINLF
jgi:DNA-binding NarL/FixJ family response regulator